MNTTEDKDSPNIFIGKEIGTLHLKGKVISFDNDTMQMQIIELSDKYYERYLDLGKTYPMFRHQQWSLEEGLILWEVDPLSMKRDVSQLLLQWEEYIGWCWDLSS